MTPSKESDTVAGVKENEKENQDTSEVKAGVKRSRSEVVGTGELEESDVKRQRK